MTKKKKNQAADDLIDALMDDLKDVIASDTSIDEVSEGSALFGMPSSEDETEGAVGLSPDEFRVEEELSGFTQWKAPEAPVVPAAPVEELFEPQDELSLNIKEIPDPDYQHSAAVQEESSGGYKGPSADQGYQSIDELFASVENSEPVVNSLSEDEKTRPIGFDPESTRPVGFGEAAPRESESSAGVDPDRTLAAEGFAAAKVGRRPAVDERVGIGSLKAAAKGGSALTFADASLVQAENLKLAQNRILDLEKEVERLRSENEELASAAEIIKTRSDEYYIQLGKAEKERQEVEESHRAEVLVLKGNLQYKETEVAKARLKVDELETRLKNDFKKIRVKERELENRLELARAEKAALLRSKDEYILDLKRKIDQLQSELDNYRSKVLELNKTLDSNQEQFKRTVRALRLALTNLEHKEGEPFPLKKAE